MVTLQKNVGGRLNLNEDGVLTKCECAECITGCGGHPSGGPACNDETPSCPGGGCCTPVRYEVTFSGMVKCEDCISPCSDGGSSGMANFPPASFWNDTFILLQDKASPCYWRYPASGDALIGVGDGYTTSYYDASDCSTGGVVQEHDEGVEIVLHRWSWTLWRLYIWATDGGGPGLGPKIFNVSVAGYEYNRCREDLEFTGDTDCACTKGGGHGQYHDIYKDGVATVEVCA